MTYTGTGSECNCTFTRVTCQMCNGLSTITDLSTAAESINCSPKLNFYTQFKVNHANASHTATDSYSPLKELGDIITITEYHMQVDVRKAGSLASPSACCTNCSLTSIFSESVAPSVVPTCFKRSIIVALPKNNKPSCLNDNYPDTLGTH